MAEVIFLDTPVEVWTEFDIDGILVRVFGTADQAYTVEVNVASGSLGPFTLQPGPFSFAVPKGQARRWGDIAWDTKVTPL